MLTLEKHTIPGAIIPGAYQTGIISLDKCPEGLILHIAMLRQEDNKYICCRVQTTDIPYPDYRQVAKLLNPAYLIGNIISTEVWSKEDFFQIIERIVPRKIIFTYF